MKLTDAHGDDAWMEAHIESYLDGDLIGPERDRFEQLLQRHDAWQRELAWAVNVRDALRATPELACPPGVLNAVMRHARRSVWTTLLNRIKNWLLGDGLLSWKPALVVATLLIVAAMLVVNGRPIPQNTDAVSQAEVEQALADVKWTLGYVSKTGRMTGSSVHDALTPLRKAPVDE